MSAKRLIFATLAFILALGLYLVDRMQAEKAVYAAVNEASLAPGINASEVQEIELQNRFGVIRLQRDKKDWWMRSPVDAPADRETVEQLLVNVTGARKRNEISAEELEQYGLDNPIVRLTLKTSKGQIFELLIGLTSTYTGQVFATYPQSKRVFTISEGVKNTLLRQPLDFQRTRLVEVDVGALDSYTTIRFEQPNRTLELRNERGHWQIAIPETAPAENAVVEEFLRRVSMLRASGFVTQDSDKPTSLAAALEALSRPVLKFELKHATQPAQQLVVGRLGPGERPIYVAKTNNAPEILHFGHEKFAEFDVDENHFRSRNLFTLRPTDVGYVIFEIGRARTDLMRNEKGEWEFVGDATRRVDQDKVNARLESLLGLKIREYVDSDPRDASVYGLAPPRFRFTVTARDKSRSEILEIGKSEPQNVTSVYARKGGDAKVFTIEMGRELIVLPESLADPHFAAFDDKKAVRVTIELGGEKYDLRRDGPEWKVLRPGHNVYSPVDLGKWRRVVETLQRLKFEKDFTASGEQVIAPVEQQTLRLTAYGDNETVLVSFEVGKRLPKTSFVTDGQKRVYEVLNSELDLLLSQLRSLLE
ncbi:MAG: DUF4340 domain-containing protein [Candidatus Sumerlaeaceae bacterium]|nr:DUF4340 domain-containing protein [Candidatus Sumerlaeaceae bacterium]